MQTFRECFLNYMEEAFEADLSLSDLKIDNIDKVEKFLKNMLTESKVYDILNTSKEQNTNH